MAETVKQRRARYRAAGRCACGRWPGARGDGNEYYRTCESCRASKARSDERQRNKTNGTNE